MYFQDFESIYYRYLIGDEQVVKVVTDITQNVRYRKTALEAVSIYDLYDVRDGETPEIIAHKYYGNSELHWIVMLSNEMYSLDDFPMDQNAFASYIQDKYNTFIAESMVYNPGQLEIAIPDHNILWTNGPDPETVTLENVWVDYTDPAQSTMPEDCWVAQRQYEPALNGTFDIANVDEGVVVVDVSWDDSDKQIVPGATLITLSQEQKLIHHYEDANGYQVDEGAMTTPITMLDWEIGENESKRRIKLIHPDFVGQMLSELKDLI